MEDSITELKLPGFRFHPTEEELLSFYLKNMISQKEPRANVIGFLNIYHHDPWDLPGLAKTRIGEREWYFFVPRDKKKGKQGRPNRTTANGFWKATGTDRKVISLSNPKKMIGMKKTMVFYKGRAPRGRKTEWVMNEFRLPDTSSSPTDIVLCKIYRKAMSLKVLEQRVAMEEETSKIRSSLLLISPVPSSSSSSSSSSSMDVKDDHPYDYFSNTQYINHHQGFVTTAPQMNLEKLEDGQQALVVVEEESFLIGNHKNKKKEETDAAGVTSETIRLQFPYGNDKLEDLQQVSKSSVDWTQDPFWTQLRSPICLDNWAFYANTTF